MSHGNQLSKKTITKEHFTYARREVTYVSIFKGKLNIFSDFFIVANQQITLVYG